MVFHKSSGHRQIVGSAFTFRFVRAILASFPCVLHGVTIGQMRGFEIVSYLGGSRDDSGYGIAVDSSDNALVSGHTESTDFAGRNNAHHDGWLDVFALKVSPSGQLLWMTYLGGSGAEFGRCGITVDNADNALVAGYTRSTDFEGRNNSYYGGGTWEQDAFALKVSPSGQLLWMTYLGGSDDEFAYGIAADDLNNALVTGSTLSTNFEGRINSHHGEYDAYALRVSPSGQLLWMTYLGGSSRDVGSGIAADGTDNVLVTGFTNSTDIAGRNNSYHGGEYDAFAISVNPSGELHWMTYLGGSDTDYGSDIAVDSADNALVSGRTRSTDFAGRMNSYYGGDLDAFALGINPSGQLLSMTYLGGSDFDFGAGIGVDNSGNALVTGWTRSRDFGGRGNSYYGVLDAFIIKLRLDDGPQLSVAATCPSGGPIQISWSGATGGGQIALIFARDTGSFIIPNNRPCAGTTLGVGSNEIQIAYQGSAGQSGSRTLNSTIGPGPCGGYLQLVDIATCGTSNVARIE